MSTEVDLWNEQWKLDPRPKQLCPNCNRLWPNPAQFCGVCGIRLEKREPKVCQHGYLGKCPVCSYYE